MKKICLYFFVFMMSMLGSMTNTFGDDSIPHHTKHHAPMPPPRHEIRACMEELSRTDPQKYQELLQLHQEDKEKFLQEIASIIQGYTPQAVIDLRNKMRELDRKCWNLARQIKNSTDEGETERLIAELGKAIEESIDLALSSTKQRITNLEHKIEDIENDRENIKNQRMEFFLSAPDIPHFQPHAKHKNQQ